MGAAAGATQPTDRPDFRSLGLPTNYGGRANRLKIRHSWSTGLPMTPSHGAEARLADEPAPSTHAAEVDRAKSATAWLRRTALALSRLRIRSLPWSTPLEWSAILVLALWFGRDFLKLDTNIWPLGGDYPLTIQLL